MELDEALDLLRGGTDGIAEWNRRWADGEEIPDLRGAKLLRAKLTHADLTISARLGAATSCPEL